MGGRVLITRPEPGAAQTAERLTALGWEPVCLPLTEIRPVAAGLPGGRTFDAVAVSSANAIRHAQPSLLRALAGLPVFAVGRRTAGEAVEAGLAVPTAGPGDGQGLARLMTGRLPRGSRVAYLCGRVRTRGFEETLGTAGIEAVPVATYDTVVIDRDEEELGAALGHGSFDAVLLHSRVAAETFLQLTDRSVRLSLFDRATLVCMSKRVTEPLIPFGKSRIRIATRPDEDSMLALLDG